MCGFFVPPCRLYPTYAYYWVLFFVKISPSQHFTPLANTGNWLTLAGAYNNLQLRILTLQGGFVNPPADQTTIEQH
jgi:hypothetical protein